MLLVPERKGLTRPKEQRAQELTSAYASRASRGSKDKSYLPSSVYVEKVSPVRKTFSTTNVSPSREKSHRRKCALLHAGGRLLHGGAAFTRTLLAPRHLRTIRAMPGSPTVNLNLWKKHLGRVPEEVWELAEQLETLVLADNDLTAVPARIGSLSRLRMLDLGHNGISALPSELGALVGLRDFLYLHDNKLSSLPESLRRMTNLRYLNLSGNLFETLPDAVCEMESLLELRLSDNQLRALPDSIGRLTRLRELHLRNNEIRTLPESIGSLIELRQLDLRQNPICFLPDALLHLPKLEKLDLRWVSTVALPVWLSELEAKGCSVYR